jgi:oligopeptide transport system substrate-binding protein
MRSGTPRTFKGIAAVIACLFAANMIISTAGDARDTLHRSNPSEPDTLDPQKASIVPDQVVISDLYHGLIGPNEKGEIVLKAAASLDVSEDGLTYTFKLRENLLWSDGVAVTAADYEAGFKRLYKPELASRAAVFAYMVKNAEGVNSGKLPSKALGVRATDDKTLVIELERPTPLFDRFVSSVWFFPVPRHAIKDGKENWFKTKTFVGNGPFVLSEWSPNDKIVLTKNPYFIDASGVKLEKVVFHPAEDTESSLRRFRAGELDFVSGMPSHKIEYLRENLSAETHIGPRPANNYVTFNTKVAPMDDVRVREALSLAIDREVYTNKVLRKGEEPAYRFVPNAVENYVSAPLPFINDTMEERQARARSLLKEAGYSNANPLTFEFRVRGSPDRKRGAVAVQSMWRAVGVRAEILSTDLKVHYADLYLGKFQAADAGFVSGTGPDLFLEELLSTNVQGNFSDYTNLEYDRVLKAAFLIADVTERHRQMAIAEQIMPKDHPVAPINFSVAGNLVATYVRGYEDNAYDTHQSRYMWIGANTH